MMKKNFYFRRELWVSNKIIWNFQDLILHLNTVGRGIQEKFFQASQAYVKARNNIKRIWKIIPERDIFVWFFSLVFVIFMKDERLERRIFGLACCWKQDVLFSFFCVPAFKFLTQYKTLSFQQDFICPFEWRYGRRFKNNWGHRFTE